jgi:predicted transcriptional regulator
MSDATVVIRVDDDLKTAFALAAKAADRTASQLLRDFMRDFVREQAVQAEREAWLREKIEISRKAARAGQLQSSESVEAYFAQRRARSRYKAGEPDR